LAAISAGSRRHETHALVSYRQSLRSEKASGEESKSVIEGVV
jgi:hypothetical protein